MQNQSHYTEIMAGSSMRGIERVDTAPRAFSLDPISDDEAAASFRAIVNLFARWGLDDEAAAILVGQPVSTYAKWKAAGLSEAGRDFRARLSNLLGIHKALRLIFVEPQRGYNWIKAPNAAFSGKSALDVMLNGELTDLMRIRRYLDLERGAW